MPPCDDHYQSVPNTTTKCQKKRDRGDRTDVHFFSEDRLFVHAFHDRPGEPSVAAPPTYKSARGASPAVEDLPGDGLRRAERRCARPPPSPSTFSPLLGGDPVAPVFCACSSLTCAAARSPGLWIWSAKCLRQRRRCARTCGRKGTGSGSGSGSGSCRVRLGYSLSLRLRRCVPLTRAPQLHSTHGFRP